MDTKFPPGAGLIEPLSMAQPGSVEPWYRVGGGSEAVGRWYSDGRHPLERCWAAAAAAAAAKYGEYDPVMFGDKQMSSVTVDCIQRYRSTSGYANYRQPLIDVKGCQRAWLNYRKLFAL